MAEIKDSGERRTFESGAVRDVAEGKGRCDLLPLDICAEILDYYSVNYDKIKYFVGRDPLADIASFIDGGDIEYIYHAVCGFAAVL
jgi:hypothetical protein